MIKKSESRKNGEKDPQSLQTEKSKTRNTRSEIFRDKVYSIYALLFLLGSIGGVILLLTTNAQWLKSFIFLSIFPMINMWTYQIVEYNKKIKYPAFIRLVVGLVSVVTVIGVLITGILEKIPAMFALSLLTAYWVFLIITAIIPFKKWWHKILIICGVILGILLFYITKPVIITIDCEKLSDVANMDVFGEITPNLAKRTVLKYEGASLRLAKNWVVQKKGVQEEYDDMGRPIKQKDESKTETFVYKRENGMLRVIFFDNSYVVGLITFLPDNMYIDDFFKEASFPKPASGKPFTIKVNSNEGETLTVQVMKDNRIEIISYYAD